MTRRHWAGPSSAFAVGQCQSLKYSGLQLHTFWWLLRIDKRSNYSSVPLAIILMEMKSSDPSFVRFFQIRFCCSLFTRKRSHKKIVSTIKINLSILQNLQIIISDWDWISSWMVYRGLIGCICSIASDPILSWKVASARHTARHAVAIVGPLIQGCWCRSRCLPTYCGN